MLSFDGITAHIEEEAYVYGRGSRRMVDAAPYEFLEFPTNAPMGEDRCFVRTERDCRAAEMAFVEVSRRFRLILSSRDVLGGPEAGVNHNHAGPLSHIDPAKLCDATFKNFVCHARDSVVLASFSKWASEHYPPNIGGIVSGGPFFGNLRRRVGAGAGWGGGGGGGGYVIPGDEIAGP